MRRFVQLMVLCILVLCVMAMASDVAEEVKRIQRIIAEGDYGLALEQVNETLKRHPSEPSLLILKCDLLWEMGEADSAVYLAEKLMEADIPRRAELRPFVLKYRLRNRQPFSVVKLYGDDVESAVADLKALLPRLIDATYTEQERNDLRIVFATCFLELSQPEDALGLLETVLETGTDKQQEWASEMFSGQYAALLADRTEDVEGLFERLIESARTEVGRNQLRLLWAEHLIRASWVGPARPDHALQDRALLLWENVMRTGTPKQHKDAWIALSNVYRNKAGEEGDALEQLFHRFMAASPTEYECSQWRLRFGEIFVNQLRVEFGKALLEMVLETGTQAQRSEAREKLQGLAFHYEQAADELWRLALNHQAPKDGMNTARAYQRKAIALSNPPRAEQYYQLARMYLGTGKRDTVIANYYKAIALSTPGSEQDRYRVNLAESYQSTHQDSLAEWNFIRVIARGTGRQEQGALHEYADFLVQRDRIQSGYTMEARMEQARSYLSIEELMANLAAILPEERYPESVQLMSLYSKRYSEATQANEKVRILLQLAKVCKETEADLKMKLAARKAYELSDGLAQKDRALSLAVHLLGCKTYEVPDLSPEHDRSFVKYWSGTGPFECTHETSQVRRSAAEDIDRVKRYSEEKGQVIWEEIVPWIGGMVDLTDRLKEHQDAVAYASTYVHIPKAQPAQVRLCGPKVAAVWFNDALIYRSGDSDTERGEHVVEVDLQEGENKILVKVVGSRTDAPFYFRLCDSQGRAIEGIKVRPGK